MTSADTSLKTAQCYTADTDDTQVSICCQSDFIDVTIYPPKRDRLFHSPAPVSYSPDSAFFHENIKADKNLFSFSSHRSFSSLRSPLSYSRPRPISYSVFPASSDSSFSDGHLIGQFSSSSAVPPAVPLPPAAQPVGSLSSAAQPVGSVSLSTAAQPVGSIFKYKKVANRVKPVPTTLPEDYRIIRIAHPDPLRDLPILPTHPPPFRPGRRFTQARYDNFVLDPAHFLLPAERDLVFWILREHEDVLAWDETEKGTLDPEYFAPVLIPTIEHIPWVMKNIPIPPGIFDQVIQIIKDKIASGIYEPSNSSYRSRWFCVVKKDGKSLRLVHDLQPLNGVSIRDPSVPYPTEHIAESFGARACYTTLDLFVAFDQRQLDPRSRDLTTFQSPLGAFRLTAIPMGYTNSQQIMHADITFILKDEIPDVCISYIDDVPIKGPATRFESADGSYETIPENAGIRKFIWIHLNDVNRILQRFKAYGITISAKKAFIATPEAIVVGHHCNILGRIPDPDRIRVVETWPPLTSVSDVRAFLGTAGVIRHFVKDFARKAYGLNRLLRKDVPFEFNAEAQRSMQALKTAVRNTSAIRAIDYTCGRPVHLCVDSSIYGFGAVLLQLGPDNERLPARFISTTWNDRERNYSQPKIELYGLFRALHAVRMYIIGLDHFFVEVDAKYIKGMINNPDLQPNATINRWIAGILLFSFTLIHVPARHHSGPDGLSRRPAALHDSAAPDASACDDFEDWIDRQYCFHTSSPSAPVTPSSPSNDHPPLDIPRSPQALAADAELIRISTFLTSLKRPSDLSDSQFRAFIRKASHFFVANESLYRKNSHGPPLLVIPPDRRPAILHTAHDELGHKGFYSVRLRIQERFWWPMIHADIKWYVRTCHQCQIRQHTRSHIPPTVPTPAPLFGRVHIDVMNLPRAQSYRYIIQARCSLTGYPEFRMLRSDSAKATAKFVFEDVICRWGSVFEIVTDNGPSFSADFARELGKYNIFHIKISPYNSRANGIVERRHLDFRECLMKLSADSDSPWPNHVYHAIWAERVTIQRTTGYSPYYMVHGVHPLLPFDITEQTFLHPFPGTRVSSADLLAVRARALQRRPADLARIHDLVLQARFRSVAHFVHLHQHTIHDYDFPPGALVLVRNSAIEVEHSRKSKPKYLGPMIVVRRTRGGAYILAEPSGAISALRYAAFRVIPYHPRPALLQSLPSFLDVPDETLDHLSQIHSTREEEEALLQTEDHLDDTPE